MLSRPSAASARPEQNGKTGCCGAVGGNKVLPPKEGVRGWVKQAILKPQPTTSRFPDRRGILGQLVLELKS